MLELPRLKGHSSSKRASPKISLLDKTIAAEPASAAADKGDCLASSKRPFSKGPGSVKDVALAVICEYCIRTVGQIRAEGQAGEQGTSRVG